jgi:carbon monoxide dehydrogenase subunit G
MEIVGERLLPAPPPLVWQALNDPAVLCACLPGCESFTAGADGVFTATMAIKVGSLAARFTGTLELSDVVPGQAWTLTGRGQGGIAGFARGQARMSLEESGAGTLVRYTIATEIGGKLANVGGRLIGAFANSTAEKFFSRMLEHLPGK